MSAEYVRDQYAVDYKVGDRLVVDGRPGLLVSFPGQYLGVRFDGERRTSRCHPTWRVARECEGCGERCDICGDRMCATWGPAPAVTCDSHRHCEDCDGDNPCRDCAAERRAA